MQTIYPTTHEISAALDGAMPDQRWRSMLELFVPTGVAEASQLQEATGLTRHKLNRALEIMRTTFLGNEPLIRRLDHTIKQPGKANRPPTVYLLAEGGAKLLREQGQDVRACELKEDTPIAHAMCMLSLHLAAQKAGKDVITDGNLAYGEGRILRPDHHFALPNGKQVIMEVEQAASPAILPRIMESLANRQAFFKSEAGKEFLPEVRMVLNVKPGSSMRRTMSIWETAMRELFKKTGDDLAFRLFVIPLEMFLESPEWGEALSKRWDEIRLGLLSNTQSESEIPQKPSRSGRALQDQVVLLLALRQDIKKRIPEAELKPNDRLFDIAVAVFKASFGDKPAEAEYKSGVPVHSLFLYKEFLNMNPELRTKLKQVIHANRGRLVMNQANILHRMNIILRAFLRNFGWSNKGTLKACASQEKQTFGDSYYVLVSIAPGYYDDQHDHELASCAMEWMLWALFEYADELELGRPEFW
jgi:hypothetical protein